MQDRKCTIRISHLTADADCCVNALRGSTEQFLRVDSTFCRTNGFSPRTSRAVADFKRDIFPNSVAVKVRMTREARMPQTIVIVSGIVIALLLLAIGGCYLAQRQVEDRTGPDIGSKPDKR